MDADRLAEEALLRRTTTMDVTKPTDPSGLTLEAWAEGYMLGSLIILSCITLANMRRGVLLHKLILLEVSWFNIVVTLAREPMADLFTSSSWGIGKASSSSSTPQSTPGGCRWPPSS